MMKKKIFAAILASAMLLSVAGCTQDNGGNEDGNQTDTVNQLKIGKMFFNWLTVFRV